jgi:hypothetical protein
VNWGRAAIFKGFLRPVRDPLIVEREKRLGRIARHHELRLLRCRSRNPRAAGFGTYALAENVRNTLFLADPQSGYGMTLDEVEHCLDEMNALSERHRLRTTSGS